MVKRVVFLSLLVVAIAAGAYIYLLIQRPRTRSTYVFEWFANPAAHADWEMEAGTRCGDAPFLFPTNGLVGFLWDDSFRPGHHHQGIDIFGGEGVNVTPVIAAYDGYLTRLSDWKSSVIQRVPSDPLQPGRQIWLYYTHMADENGESYISDEFPAGTSEVFVSAGTLLGYQGNYSGDPNNPVGVHLHFSIVRDDGNGNFLNELEIKNTYNPSLYFGLELNANDSQGEVPLCPIP